MKFILILIVVLPNLSYSQIGEAKSQTYRTGKSFIKSPSQQKNDKTNSTTPERRFDLSTSSNSFRIVVETEIDGVFEGWTGETIFKLRNGQIWQQSKYKYLYHYAYNPKIKICEDNGIYKMIIEGLEESIEVKLINNGASGRTSSEYTISEIDGEFKGWSGETIFKLKNGQIWQQTGYESFYKYSYGPKVTILYEYPVYKMKVDGVDKIITVKQIK